jgi:hypothetical protein
VTDEPHVPAEESPETEGVRRLLAQARHDAPMPDDVAARLDRVLAELATSPAADAPVRAERPERRVVPLLPAHRRRRAAALLVAAAAVVVGGVVVAQHPPGGGSTVGGTAASGGGNQEFSAESGDKQAQDQHGPARQPAPRAAAQRPTIRNGSIVVHGSSFADDARAGQALLAGGRTRALATPTASCPAPSRGQRVVPALYAGAPAALVYHRPRGSTQVVDLVLCGSPGAVRSVTLPVP